MAQQHVQLLAERRIGKPVAGLEEMNHLPDEPRLAIGAAADHQSVGLRLGERLARIFQRHDVAIGDDRDCHRRLHRADEPPVRFALVELAARAAMHRDHADAAILRDPGQARRVAAVVVPAGAHLERHRKIDRLDRGFENARGVKFVAHQRRAGVTVHHLFHRAAEIDVDDGGAAIGVELRRLGHHRGLATGELHRHRLLVMFAFRHRQRAAAFADHRLAGDHLRHHQPGAEGFDQTPERQIGHP